MDHMFHSLHTFHVSLCTVQKISFTKLSDRVQLSFMILYLFALLCKIKSASGELYNLFIILLYVCLYLKLFNTQCLFPNIMRETSFFMKASLVDYSC